MVRSDSPQVSTIDIYTTPQCGFCKQLKSMLDADGRKHTAHDVTASEETLKEMQTLSNGAMSVPVLVLDKGKDTQKVGVGFEEAKNLLGLGGKKTKDTPGETAILTCPLCNHKQPGVIPTTSCVPFYFCEGCRKTIQAKNGTCCVFCSYADRPCPLKSSKKECEDGTCAIH